MSRLPSLYNKTVVTTAIGVIVISTITLSYLSYRYTIGRANLVEATLMQSNNTLIDQSIKRIEQKIIDNDSVLYNMVDVNDSSDWPAAAEAIKKADLNVDQVWFLQPNGRPLYFPRADARTAHAFRRGFLDKARELNLEALHPDEANHLHREKSDDYFFGTYVIKESRKGERILICFQVSFDRTIALINRYVKELERTHYISIVDFENNAVYGEPVQRNRYFYEQRFPTTFYKWILQSVPRNYTELERDERNQRRMFVVLIVLSMFLTFLSLAVIYVGGRRERQLVQLKEDFIANVSHELKTPLSLIRMFSEILVSGRVKDDSTRSEYFGIIHNESDRMSRLINNLLDFASLERGVRRKNFQATNLALLVKRELETYRYQIEKEGFTLVTELPESAPETLADPTALSLALYNLLDNSLKYSGERKEIQVRVAQSNGFIDLAVSDRGLGIPQSEHAQIFEKFYRGSSSAVQKTRGNGIGLAITKQIAEMHGGEVRVDSEPGRGSTFTLRIPIRQKPLEETGGADTDR
jgi:two-component system phosphate regulon sensor histidine kinase PhoR